MMTNIVLFPLQPSPDGGSPKARFDLKLMTLPQLEDLRDALAIVNEALDEITNALAHSPSRLILLDDRD